ncbi:MAG: ABC transporter permease [Candidatus Odinarchaeota archaeon]
MVVVFKPGNLARELVVFKSLYLAHLKNLKAYVQNFLFSLISYPAQVIMFFFLWNAILSTTDLGGVTSQDLLAYYLLAFLIDRLTSNRRTTDNVEDEIITGNMVNYFIRPVPMQSYHLAAYISQLTVTSMLMIPIAFILLEIFCPAQVILTPLSITFFIIIVFLSGLCQFLMFFSIGILAFWLERVWGITMGFNWINGFFSGRLIPLYLFPAALIGAVGLLPFRFFTYELVMLLLSPITFEQAISNTLFLMVWLVVLITLSWLLLKYGTRKFTGYGV